MIIEVLPLLACPLSYPCETARLRSQLPSTARILHTWLPRKLRLLGLCFSGLQNPDCAFWPLIACDWLAPLALYQCAAPPWPSATSPQKAQGLPRAKGD